MEHKKWFTFVEGQIRGPFSPSDLERQMTAMPTALIWGRGQTEWVNPDKWQKISQDSESARTGNDRQDRMWRIVSDGKELVPMNHDDMIRFLKSKSDLANIRLWTEGYSEWRDIYQIHKIMDELGVSRRTHPRVPIMGTIICEGAGGTFQARLLSISEGGLGATEAAQVKIGERLKVIIKSSNLSVVIHATVEVVYVGNDGYFGMKFIALQTESQSLIIEYIKKFLVSNPALK